MWTLESQPECRKYLGLGRGSGWPERAGLGLKNVQFTHTSNFTLNLLIHSINVNGNVTTDWRDDSMVKSTSCSPTGPDFRVPRTHIRWFITIYSSGPRGPSVVFWPLQAPALLCTYPHKHINKKINKRNQLLHLESIQDAYPAPLAVAMVQRGHTYHDQSTKNDTEHFITTRIPPGALWGVPPTSRPPHPLLIPDNH